MRHLWVSPPVTKSGKDRINSEHWVPENIDWGKLTDDIDFNTTRYIHSTPEPPKYEYKIAIPPHSFDPQRKPVLLRREPPRIGRYSEERSQLHDKIIEGTLRPGKPSDHPYLLVVAGGPTAGKSTLLSALRKGGVVPDKGVVLINTRPFEILPEVKEHPDSRHPEKTQQLLNEYYDLVWFMLEEAAKRRLPVILEEHGEHWQFLNALMPHVREAGYETAMVGMTTSPELYFKYEQKRCESKEKNPDHPWSLKCHSNFAKNWGRYTKLFDNCLLCKRNEVGAPLSIIAHSNRTADGKVTHEIIDKEFYNGTFKLWEYVNIDAKNAEEAYPHLRATGRRIHQPYDVGGRGEGGGTGSSAKRSEAVKAIGAKIDTDTQLTFTERLSQFTDEMSKSPKK